MKTNLMAATVCFKWVYISMANQNKTKLNKLLRLWVPGTIAVPLWLKSLGISSFLATWYLKSGWLEAIARGAYKRPGDQVEWTGGLFAIQQHLGLSIHLAAKSAIEMQGHAHYVRLHDKKVQLFGSPKVSLPSWFVKNNCWDIKVEYHATNLFTDLDLGLTTKKVLSYEVKLSTLERAMMEFLYLVPSEESLQEAYLIMGSLNTLRPKLVQQLLENCNSLKVKRLFMVLAELYNHAWLKYLNLEHVDFGKGKRSVSGGGVYNAKYQIALPLLAGEEDDERDI